MEEPAKEYPDNEEQRHCSQSSVSEKLSSDQESLFSQKKKI